MVVLSTVAASPTPVSSRLDEFRREAFLRAEPSLPHADGEWIFDFRCPCSAPTPRPIQDGNDLQNSFADIDGGADGVISAGGRVWGDWGASSAGSSDFASLRLVTSPSSSSSSSSLSGTFAPAPVTTIAPTAEDRTGTLSPSTASPTSMPSYWVGSEELVPTPSPALLRRPGTRSPVSTNGPVMAQPLVSTETDSGSSGSSPSTREVAAIVGGTIGGLAVLIVFGVVVRLMQKRGAPNGGGSPPKSSRRPSIVPGAGPTPKNAALPSPAGNGGAGEAEKPPSSRRHFFPRRPGS